MEKEIKIRAAAAFGYREDEVGKTQFGSGHINDTYLLSGSDPLRRAVLQRINVNVFHHPLELMANFDGITRHLRRKVALAGGDPDREVLTALSMTDGGSCYIDEEGYGWRVTRFIERSVSCDSVTDPAVFEESGRAFGRFQKMLSDYPAETLYETIPGFHDTPSRLAAFRASCKRDAAGRAKTCREDILLAEKQSYLAYVYRKADRRKKIPVRAAHNDTKLNNVLFDADTKKALCVIDLDTVMPGYAMNDFGDAIRFGASTAAEDEKDLSRVSCDTALFAAYTRGFLAGAEGVFSPEEQYLLPDGAMVMTYENGIRFLKDYLDGDTYYKIDYPEQNLDRARTQFALVADMERKLTELRGIVAAAGR